MNLTQSDLHLFLGKFSIYRNSYNKKIKDQWYKCDYYLTDEKLLKSINNSEESDIAYFSCYKTNFFAIDIDNHDGKTNLNKSFEIVLSKLGKPSLISKSPRGLHVYYSFKEKISADVVVEHLNQMFLGNNFEFKPISDSALRTINVNKLLDSNLKIIKKDFASIIMESATYNFSELFPDKLIQKVSNKITTSSQWSSIGNGETNEAIKSLIPIWKSQGHSAETCTQMFQAKLSSDYNGECLRYDKVLKRVKSFFKKEILWTIPEIKTDIDSIKESNLDLINLIIGLHRKKCKKILPRREQIISDIVISSISKKQKSQELFSNARSRAYMASKHPYFDYEVGRGNTPLPSKLFSSIASNYHYALNFLITIGFLTRKNGRSYDSIKGSCQYYFVDINLNKKYSEFAYSTVSNIHETILLVRDSLSTQLMSLSNLFKIRINKCYNMFILSQGTSYQNNNCNSFNLIFDS